MSSSYFQGAPVATVKEELAREKRKIQPKSATSTPSKRSCQKRVKRKKKSQNRKCQRNLFKTKKRSIDKILACRDRHTNHPGRPSESITELETGLTRLLCRATSSVKPCSTCLQQTTPTSPHTQWTTILSSIHLKGPITLHTVPGHAPPLCQTNPNDTHLGPDQS